MAGLQIKKLSVYLQHILENQRDFTHQTSHSMKSFLLNNVLPVLTLVLVASVAAMAQPGSGGVVPTPTPIDGGISLLLASGIAYGVKNLKARRRRA